jgi:hypothetical protein
MVAAPSEVIVSFAESKQRGLKSVVKRGAALDSEYAEQEGKYPKAKRIRL